MKQSKEKKMITFEKLLERAKSEKIAVHTPTAEQAKTLLTELDEKGYVWNGGEKLTTEICYEAFREDTCYDFDLNKQVWYDSCGYCQEEGYTIIEFKDIDFKTLKKAH